MLNSKILIFLLSFFTAALTYSALLVFMPKTPVFYVPVKKEFEYYKINLANLFYKAKPVKKPTVIKTAQTLKGIKLKALYNSGKNGFIIIEDKGKTHFIDLGQKYKGYKLVKINPDSAIFEKNSKNYKIEFEEKKLKSDFYKEPSQKEETKKISKAIFKEYKNNLNKVWRNIGIVKKKEGYKIVYVKPKSIFDQIGLKKGDIILEVNGRELKNDADAWDLYKNADKFEEFEIKIKRNNNEKVLYYEVD